MKPDASPLIRTLDLRGLRLARSGYSSKLPRASLDVKAALAQVEPIINAVRDGDVSTLLSFSERFDGVRPREIRVPESKIQSALANLDSNLRRVIEESIRRVRIVHKEQVRSESIVRVVDGGEVEERWIPVDRVGLYVPAGRAVYPSSVIMNVVPAQIAGVGSIALASPPQQDNDGWPDDLVLATCALLGIYEIYSMGGAQAIAAMAFGTASIQKVDKIFGPGNQYVTAAKQLVQLEGVAIDMPAGPSEVCIIADETSNPTFVAADLLAQAEHGPDSQVMLVANDMRVIQDTMTELNKQVAVLDRKQIREQY